MGSCWTRSRWWWVRPVPARRSWRSSACSPTPPPERPGLYLSTVSEPFDKLLRYGQSLEFFDTAQLGRSVFYDDLGDAVHQDGLPAVLERLDTLIKAASAGHRRDRQLQGAANVRRERCRVPSVPP